MSRAPDAGQRLLFIDRLRGLAVVVMIEVHVVNALLATRLRQGALYEAVDAVNGLVAPAFLLCAGFAVARTLRPAWNDPTRFRGLLARHLRRALYVFALGYLLHVSGLFPMLREAFTGNDGEGARAVRDASLRLFLQADVLQIIALSIAALALLASALRTRARFAAACSATAFAVLFATPFVRALDVSRWPMAIQPYFTDRVESQFPLLPWAGFAFAGAALGALRADETDAPRTTWTRAFGTAFVIAASLATALSFAPATLFPPHDPGRAGPTHMLARLAAVGLIGAALAQYEQRRVGAPSSWVDRTLLLFSERSLLVYFVHIGIVYGRHPLSLRSLLGESLSASTCALAWLLVTLAMLALAAARRAMVGASARAHAPTQPAS